MPRAAPPPVALMKTRRLLRLLLRDIPRAGIGAIILIAIAINFANIVARYMFLAPLDWAEEVLVFLVIWGVCLGASAVTYDKPPSRHELGRRRLPASNARRARIPENRGAGDLFSADSGQRLDHRRDHGGQRPGQHHRRRSMTIPYAAFVLGFGLIAVAAIAGAFDRRAQREAAAAGPPQV